MTWPDAITLYAFGVLIGAPLLGRVLRGATIPPPEAGPPHLGPGRRHAERVHVLPGVTIHKCGCIWCPRHTAVRAERDRAAEHAQWARQMEEQMRREPE